MSDERTTLDDPDLGVFTRATTELADGSVLTHDWYAGTLPHDDADIELLLEATTTEEACARLPRLRSVVSELETVHRAATDAVVSAFSQGDPDAQELDAAASDLALEAIEVSADGSVVLHLTDVCGEHFPEGYWPAAHLDAGGTVRTVTVES
ncbi:hypothetical protein [Microbacterium sp. 179-I 3D4 NHS]|uniref:hypothetical protein n=1 Tax=Microbacterium sp. 179-I 3D4 NHS TaxID=3142381 RepID=UPI0039A3A427